MLELFLCSLFTILPDYLLRRHFQGKRFGEHINFFNVWYELRWGITLCAMLTITLITIVFYFHPSTSNVASFFRTVTILSEAGGRVEEVYVRNNQPVKAGDPIFKLDSSRQEAAREAALRQIAEVDAALVLAQADRAVALATVDQAKASYQQTFEDLERRRTLKAQGSSVVSERDVEVLENELSAQQGAVDAAVATVASVDANVAVALPAQKSSAEAALKQAEVEIEKLTIYAGTDGTIEQLSLQVGDIVSPVLRPAGILVPIGSGHDLFQAGFPQISAQVVKPGGVAEMICMAMPFTIIPMVIVSVQDVIASGQIRPTDRLVDLNAQRALGTLTVGMSPIYAGQTDDIPPGSRCFVNAYTSNHDKLEDSDLGFGTRIFLHVVDTVGVIHAAGLRIRSLLMPLRTLVFTGH